MNNIIKALNLNDHTKEVILEAIKLAYQKKDKLAACKTEAREPDFTSTHG